MLNKSAMPQTSTQPSATIFSIDKKNDSLNEKTMHDFEANFVEGQSKTNVGNVSSTFLRNFMKMLPKWRQAS